MSCSSFALKFKDLSNNIIFNKRNKNMKSILKFEKGVVKNYKFLQDFFFSALKFKIYHKNTIFNKRTRV